MFKLKKPLDEDLQRAVSVAMSAPAMRAEFLSAAEIEENRQAPPGFAQDRLKKQIGVGDQAFAAAIRGFVSWKQFDLGWARVANPAAPIEVGQIVAVQVHSLGLWSLNLSQIVDVENTETRFGFVYKTTRNHVEEGEERFSLTIAPGTGEVWYETAALSTPRYWMARVGLPVTRSFQHRFARDSHRRMRQLVCDGT